MLTLIYTLKDSKVSFPFSVYFFTFLAKRFKRPIVIWADIIVQNDFLTNFEKLLQDSPSHSKHAVEIRLRFGLIIVLSYFFLTYLASIKPKKIKYISKKHNPMNSNFWSDRWLFPESALLFPTGKNFKKIQFVCYVNTADE